MSVTSRSLRYADYTARAVAVLCSLGALYLWAQSLLWWGDAMAMASALTWTLVALVVWGVVMLAEWVRNRGE